jgi:hypothetical protein
MFKIKLNFIFLLIPSILLAQPNVENKYLQKFTEIGIHGGVAGYAGDIGGALGSNRFKDASFGLLRPAFGINATHRMSDWASFRPGITVAQVMGDDATIPSPSETGAILSERNLSFRSNIAEFSLLADVNPLYIIRSYGRKDHKFNPYVSVGFGMFYYNPQANLDGTWYDLKPLRLEGQGFPDYPDRKQYSRISFNIPFGAGFKYYVSSKNYIGLEGMIRRTFTDYLDDVSKTYIDPAYFDAYLSPENAALARQLNSRGTPNVAYVGGLRGNRPSDDYYYTVSLRFGFILNNHTKKQ